MSILSTVDNIFNKYIDPYSETGKIFYKNIDVLSLKIEVLQLINKPVETTNEQPKSATTDCGSEGCDHYKYDHICRCQ